jgi:hypothetical protein
MKKRLAMALLAVTLVSNSAQALDVMTPGKTIKKSYSGASAAQQTTQTTWTRILNMFYGMFLVR